MRFFRIGIPKVFEKLPTNVIGIRFSDGNANGITVNNSLSRLWSLVDNQSELNWQIVAGRQKSDVQVSGVKFGFGLFITQSFDRWNSGLSWSRMALTLYVQMERHECACRQIT